MPETWTSALTEQCVILTSSHSDCALGTNRTDFDGAIFRHFHNE